MHRQHLSESDVVVRDGLRVTSPERTFLDLAQHLSLHELVAFGDAALNLRRTTPEALSRRVGEVNRRPGIVLARTVIPLLDGRAQSPPETYARLWIIRAGLPAPTPQLSVRDRDGILLGHSDLGYDEWKLAMEYEGRGHSEPGQFGYDIDRYSRMTAAGWLVLRFSAAHLREDGRELVALTLMALRSRGFRG